MNEKKYYVISMVICHWDSGYGDDDRWSNPSFVFNGTEEEVKDLVERYNSKSDALTEYSGLEDLHMTYCEVPFITTSDYRLIDHLMVESAFDDADWEHPEIVSRIYKFKTTLNSIHD